MQILIAVLVAGAGVALVLVPLMRGGARYDVSGDLDEEPVPPDAAPRAQPAPAGPVPDLPEPTPPAADAEDVAVAVAAEVPDADVAFGTLVGLDGLVARYRAAVRADTVCPRCRQANPPGSRFCYECGAEIREEDEGEGEGAAAASA